MILARILGSDAVTPRAKAMMLAVGVGVLLLLGVGLLLLLDALLAVSLPIVAADALTMPLVLGVGVYFAAYGYLKARQEGSYAAAYEVLIGVGAVLGVLTGGVIARRLLSLMTALPSVVCGAVGGLMGIVGALLASLSERR